MKFFRRRWNHPVYGSLESILSCKINVYPLNRLHDSYKWFGSIVAVGPSELSFASTSFIQHLSVVINKVEL